MANELAEITPTMWETIIGCVVAIMGYFFKKRDERIEENEMDIDDIVETINEHKLYVSENYVKKDVIERIHVRIDGIADDIGDIKTLIVETLNGSHK